MSRFDDLMKERRKKMLLESPMWEKPEGYREIDGEVVSEAEMVRKGVPKLDKPIYLSDLTGSRPLDFKKSEEGDKKEMGFLDTWADEWTGQKGYYKVPFAGGLLAVGDNKQVQWAAERLEEYKKNPNLYKEKIVRKKKGLLGEKWDWYGKRQMEGVTDEDIEKEATSMYLDDMFKVQQFVKHQQEEAQKEYTFWGKTMRGVSQLPTLAVEFYATGPITGSVKAGTAKTATKMIGHQVKSKAGRFALEATKTATGAAVRTALRPEAYEGITNLQAQEALGADVKSKDYVRAVGEAYIENFSEDLGEHLTRGGVALARGAKFKKLVDKSKFGRKVFRGLEKLALSEGGDTKSFWNKVSTKAGFSSFVAEHGEERISTILRSAAGFQGEGNIAQRIMQGMAEDYSWENLGPETVVLGGMQLSKVKSEFSNNRWLNHEAKRILDPESYKKFTPEERRQAVQEYAINKLAEGQRPFSPESILAGHLNEVTAEELSPYTPPAKLTQRIRDAKLERKATEEELHKGRQRQAAIAEEIMSREDIPYDIRHKQAKSALRGKLSDRRLSPIVDKMSPTEVKALHDKIQNSNLRTFERMRAHGALLDLMNPDGAIVPTNSEIQLLGKVLGSDVAKALVDKRSFGRKARDVALDLGHLPRTFKASLDNSFALRQGIFLATSHPLQFAKWWGKSWVAFADKTYTVEQQEMIRNHDFYQLAMNAGLYEAPIMDEYTSSTERSEEYMSRYAEDVPGIAGSNRSYATFGNQARFNLFYKFAYEMQQRGQTYENNPAAYNQMAKLLNLATGRGDLKGLEKYGSILNLGFFAPRYTLSRIQYANMGIKSTFSKNMDPMVRKEALRQWGSFLTMGFSILGLLMANGADVEKDPKSSDFGKIKVGEDGNTRIDIWGGYQQYARYFAQFASGKGKSTGTGREYDKSRGETAFQFFRSKASPLAGLTIDTLITKRTMMGEPMTKQQFAKELGKFAVPISFEDMYDIYQIEGFNSTSIPVIGAMIHGAGVGTWEPTAQAKYSNAKTDIAMERFGMAFEDLAPSQAKALMANNVYLDTLKKASDFERNGTPQMVARVVASNEKEAADVYNRLGTKAKKIMNDFKVKMPGVPSRLGDWYINDERFEIYKEYMARTITHYLNRIDTSKLDPSNPAHSDAIKEVINDARKHAREYIKAYAEREVQSQKGGK